MTRPEEPTASLEDAVTHLQAAAREMIAAARAVLDLTEDLVEDPGPLLAVLSSLAAAGRAPGRREGTAAAPAGGEQGAEADDETMPPSRPRVQHIRIS